MGAERIGGIAGLLFAGGVLLQNGVLLQGMPLPGASLAEVASFYEGRALPSAVATGWVAINVPLLLTFGAAVSRRMEATPAAATWGRAGLAGIALLAAAFGSTTWLQATLTARAAELARAGQLGLVWDLHTAAFSGSGVALAATIGAFSLGAWSDGTVPRWTAVVGLAGAGLLAISGLLAVGTVGGGPGIFFQFGGFATWVVWLLTASIGMIRRGGS